MAVAGGVMLYFAYQHYNSFMGSITRAIAKTPPESFYKMLIPGIILSIVGLGLFIKPSKKKAKKKKKKKK